MPERSSTTPTNSSGAAQGRPPRVLLVGHCGPDTHMLRSAVRRALPEAEVVSVLTQKELETNAADLLLVNRVLDGSFETSSGVDLIRKVASRRAGEHPAMMLISNYSDAQDEARAAGALPGFGKREVNAQATASLLREALGSAHRA